MWLIPSHFKRHHDNVFSRFVVYNLNTKDKKVVNNESLIYDGHPVFWDDKQRFIADTYPLDNCIQELFVSSVVEGFKNVNILKAFSDPRLYIEHRCDMHPRLKGQLITLDSTFSDGVRKIVLLKLNEKML